MCGSVSMEGGHGYALAFGKTIESLGIENACAIGIAAATLGLITGGLLGGPVGRFLIYKYDLKPLKGMNGLESLAFTAPISSVEGIEEFPSLNFLSVSFSLVKDLTPITGAENLQVIDISNAEIENYEALFKHTGLKEVRCSEEQKQEILKVNSFPDFEIYT